MAGIQVSRPVAEFTTAPGRISFYEQIGQRCRIIAIAGDDLIAIRIASDRCQRWGRRDDGGIVGRDDRRRLNAAGNGEPQRIADEYRLLNGLSGRERTTCASRIKVRTTSGSRSNGIYQSRAGRQARERDLQGCRESRLSRIRNPQIDGELSTAARVTCVAIGDIDVSGYARQDFKRGDVILSKRQLQVALRCRQYSQLIFPRRKHGEIQFGGASGGVVERGSDIDHLARRRFSEGDSSAALVTEAAVASARISTLNVNEARFQP